MTSQQGTRINKYLSEIGHCSRREADKLIEQKRITINGKFAVAGSKIGHRDQIKIDGQKIASPDAEAIYLAFNKPTGIVCTTDTRGEKNNIIDYVNYPKRIFPIGRLDKESEGLIFLTNDGDIVNKILRAGNKHEKEYLVTVNKPITADFIQKMGAGIPILGVTTKKCKIEQAGANGFNITLTQGLNRQIRRMCEYLGYEVLKLKRLRIMNISLDIPVGQWRDLSAAEVQKINQLVSGSSKTDKPKSKSQQTPKGSTSKARKGTAPSKKFKSKNPNKFTEKHADKSGRGRRGAAASSRKRSR